MPADPTRLAVAFVLRLLVSLALLLWVWRRSASLSKRLLGDPPWDLSLCATALLTATAVLLPALLLGALGWLRDWAWAASVALAALLLPRLALISPRAENAGAALGDAPSKVFCTVLGGLLLGRALFGLRNPPADWDSLQYHLPMVGYWIQSGALGVAFRSPPALGAYYPGNVELIQMWAALSIGRETFMSWPGILGLGLLALATRRASLLLGAGRFSAEVAALSVVAAPGILQLTLGTRIDLLHGAWAACAILFLLYAQAFAHAGSLALALLALGLLAGSKANGPPLALLLLGCQLWSTWRRSGWQTLRAQRWSVPLALGLGLFWLVRNFAAAGNPMFPMTLRLGALHLPGLTDPAALARTSQLWLWLHGYAGHLTAGNLIRVFGWAVPLLALIALVGVLRGIVGRAARPGTQPPARPMPDRGWLIAFVAGSFALFLLSPFSGSFSAPAPGRPPGLNVDNLRYLMPTLVALLPLAAAAVSAWGAHAVLNGALTLLVALGCARFARHVLPGVLLAALAVALAPRIARGQMSAVAKPASMIGLALLLGGAATLVDAHRERIVDRIWDGYLARTHNLPSDIIRQLRQEAAGRPIAIAGMDAWSAYYGRDLRGRPVYVSPSEPWRATSRPYHFPSAAEGLARRDLWLENLGRSGAAFVVIGPPQGHCEAMPPEAAWCSQDSVRFALVARSGCDLAYRVVSVPAEERGR